MIPGELAVRFDWATLWPTAQGFDFDAMRTVGRLAVVRRGPRTRVWRSGLDFAVAKWFMGARKFDVSGDGLRSLTLEEQFEAVAEFQAAMQTGPFLATRIDVARQLPAGCGFILPARASCSMIAEVDSPSGFTRQYDAQGAGEGADIRVREYEKEGEDHRFEVQVRMPRCPWLLAAAWALDEAARQADLWCPGFLGRTMQQPVVFVPTVAQRSALCAAKRGSGMMARLAALMADTAFGGALQRVVDAVQAAEAVSDLAVFGCETPEGVSRPKAEPEVRVPLVTRTSSAQALESPPGVTAPAVARAARSYAAYCDCGCAANLHDQERGRCTECDCPRFRPLTPTKAEDEGWR